MLRCIKWLAHGEPSASGQNQPCQAGDDGSDADIELLHKITSPRRVWFQLASAKDELYPLRWVRHRSHEPLPSPLDSIVKVQVGSGSFAGSSGSQR